MITHLICWCVPMNRGSSASYGIVGTKATIVSCHGSCAIVRYIAMSIISYGTVKISTIVIGVISATSESNEFIF